MSKSKVDTNRRFPAEKIGGWDSLIAEARQRIQDLQFSIQVFEKKKAANEPAPFIPQSDSGLIGAASGNGR